MEKKSAVDQSRSPLVIPGLAEFKLTARPESAILVDTYPARRAMAAWLIYPHTLKRPDGPIPEPTDPKYPTWIWSWTYVDLEYLARLAAVDAWIMVSLWEQLKATRMVFPDGTIHESAKIMLENAIKPSEKKNS